MNIQDLLTKEAITTNIVERAMVREAIVALREANSEPPACWGQDDCSTQALSVCPYRFDCNASDRRMLYCS